MMSLTFDWDGDINVSGKLKQNGQDINEEISSVKNAIAKNRATLGIQRVNIFDGELKAGDISSETGNDLGGAPTVITKNYIAVTPNAIISISRTENSGYMSWRFYDENKNYLGIADDSNITLIHGYNTSNVLTHHMSFGCFKLINPRIKYMRFRDHTNSLSNVYTIVEGEYTEDTMPVYEPYKPSVNERLVEVENDITNINTTLSNTMQSTNITIIPGGVQKYVKIGMTSGAVTEYLIIMQTTTGAGYATYLFRGYGDGGTARCRITRLNGGTSPSIFLNNRDLYIKLFDTDNTHYISVYILQGTTPTLTVAENYTGDALATTLPTELEARLTAIESALNTTGGDE